MFKKKVFMIFLCLMVMFGFSREVLAITWKAKNGSVQVKYVHTPHSTVLNKKICYTKDGKEHCKTAYCTGLRVAEVFALTWNDIDFRNKTISVNKNILKRNQAGRNKTKTFKWQFNYSMVFWNL